MQAFEIGKTYTVEYLKNGRHWMPSIIEFKKRTKKTVTDTFDNKWKIYEDVSGIERFHCSTVVVRADAKSEQSATKDLVLLISNY